MATHPAQYAHPEALVETDWLEKHLDDDGIRERVRQGALGTLDRDQTVGDVDVDPAGNRDRKSSDSGHEFVSSCYQT